MKTNRDYPFVAVHIKDKEPMFGYMYSENHWSVTVKVMSSNEDPGRVLQINQKQIEFIESMDISEAPWNE